MYKILTIEDDLLIAEDLNDKLTGLGYQVLGNAPNSDDAIALAKDKMPEIIIADITLRDSMDGIDTIRSIYKFHLCPVIYLTANSESTTVKKAMATQPAAFMLKPYRLSEFSINIDLAITNFKQKYDLEKVNLLVHDSIFLPDNYVYKRVYKSDILFIKADSNYTEVVTIKGKSNYSIPIKFFHEQLSDRSFLRVSRSYIINSGHVTAINGNMLHVAGDHRIKISRSQRQEILERFPIFRTK